MISLSLTRLNRFVLFHSPSQCSGSVIVYSICNCLPPREQPEALHDAQLFAGNGRAALIHPVVIAAEVARVDDERVAFPAPNRLAVERADDDVGVGVLTAVEEDRPEAVHELADHVDPPLAAESSPSASSAS